MILPHPESDLSLNLMVLGSDIIKLLHKRDYVLIDDVMGEFLTVSPKRTPEHFLNALTFLYTINVIERKQFKIKLIVADETPIQQTLFLE